MKDNNQLVSIIILNWNGLQDTINCLDSVLQITYANYKIIVIDNGSTINEAHILQKRYKNKITVFRTEKNLGYSGGVNFGIKKSFKYKPDFFLLLNNDVIVTKEFLNNLVETSKSNHAIGVVSPIIYDLEQKSKVLFSGGDINWILARPYNKTDIPKSVRFENFITGCSMLIKNDVIHKVGLFDNQYFAYFEDAAFSYSAQKAGYLLKCDTQAIIYHKESATAGRESTFYTYLFSRNRIIFTYTFIPKIFGIYYVFYFTLRLIAALLYFLFTNQINRARAYFRGYIDGYTKKLNFPIL